MRHFGGKQEGLTGFVMVEAERLTVEWLQGFVEEIVAKEMS